MAGDGGADQPETRKTIVALDSGAYSAYTQNTTIDIDAYIEFVQRHQHLLTFYVNLDVIGHGEKSYQNWLYIRSKGLNPVPVYHSGTPIDYLEKYLSKADYIGIGAIADLDKRRRIFDLTKLWNNYLLDANKRPKAKFHGFGLTDSEIISRFRWHSVDSTSWVKTGSYGHIYVPRKSAYGYIYDRSAYTLTVSARAPPKGRHINALPSYQRHKVMRYIEEKGFPLGRGAEEDDGDFEPGLCNDHKIRDQLNAIYFLDLQKASGTIVYLAGNFPALAKPMIERQIQQKVNSYGMDYYRMISFYDGPKIQTVLDLKREEMMK